jgi:hypothetical protein
MDQMSIINIYKIVHLTATEYTVLSSVHETFYKIIIF